MVASESASKRFERTFLADLRDQLPGAKISEIDFTGLIARVNFHQRRHEGQRSGADFGVVVSRPSAVSDGSNWTIHRLIHHGLLAQAKLNQRNKERYPAWGVLKKKQREVILNHSPCFALLIYELSGESRNQLEPFRWQSCNGCLPKDAQQWLKTGNFPSPIDSQRLIQGLDRGEIGTTDERVIASLIDPESPRLNTIEIEVYWPTGKGPPPVSSGRLVRVREEEKERQRILNEPNLW